MESPIILIYNYTIGSAREGEVISKASSRNVKHARHIKNRDEGAKLSHVLVTRTYLNFQSHAMSQPTTLAIRKLICSLLTA